jgi:hypothetical protein
MNLVVGVLCEEGVVVGAAESRSSRAGAVDAAQDASANTFVVQGDLILAGSGRAGLGQRFAEVVGAIRSDSRFPKWTGMTVTKSICAEAVEDFAATRCDPGQFGALLAFAACDGFQLCEFAASDLQPELKTPDRWFASMGAGKPVADPFFAFLQRALFADSQPPLAEGLLLVTWVLDYAVGLDAGVGGNSVRIALLAEEHVDLPPSARVLSESALADCLGEVRAAERHLASYRRARGSPHE